MRRFHKTFIGFLALCILFLLSFGRYFFSRELKTVSQNVHYGPAGEILPDRSVGQTFFCPRKNLSAVEILLATYRRRNDCSLEFTLYQISDPRQPISDNQPAESEMEDKRNIREVALNASHIKDNEYFRFRFQPVHDSAANWFLFRLASQNATPGNAVTVYHSGNDALEKGFAVLNGKATDKDLVFNAFVRVSSAEYVKKLISRIIHNKPFPFSIPLLFYCTLSVFFIMSVILSLALVHWGYERNHHDDRGLKK